MNTQASALYEFAKPYFGDESGTMEAMSGDHLANGSAATSPVDGWVLRHDCFDQVNDTYTDLNTADFEWKLLSVSDTQSLGNDFKRRPTSNAIPPTKNWRMILYQAKSCSDNRDKCTYPSYAHFFSSGKKGVKEEAYNLVKRFRLSSNDESEWWQNDEDFAQTCFDVCLNSHRYDANDLDGLQYRILNMDVNEDSLDEYTRERYRSKYKDFSEVYKPFAFRCQSFALVEDVMNRPIDERDVYESADMPWLSIYRPLNLSRPSETQKRLMCVFSDVAYADKRTVPSEWYTPFRWDVYTHVDNGATAPFERMLGGSVDRETAVLSGAAFQMRRTSKLYDRQGWEYWSLMRDYGNRLYFDTSDSGQTDAYVVRHTDSEASCICKPDTGTKQPHMHSSTGESVCGNPLARPSSSSEGSNTEPEAFPEILDNLFSRCYMPPAQSSNDTSYREDECRETADPPLYGDAYLCTYRSHLAWRVDCFPTFGVCSSRSTAEECERSPERVPICAWQEDRCHQRYVTCEALTYDLASGQCRGDARKCEELNGTDCSSVRGCAGTDGACYEQVDAARDCAPLEEMSGSDCFAIARTERTIRNLFYPDAAGDDQHRRRLSRYTTSGMYASDPIRAACGGEVPVSEDGVVNISARYVLCDEETSDDETIGRYGAVAHKAYVLNGAVHADLLLSVAAAYEFRLDRSTSSDPMHSLDETSVGYDFVPTRVEDGMLASTELDVLIDDTGRAFERPMRGVDVYYDGETDDSHAVFYVRPASLFANSSYFSSLGGTSFRRVANTRESSECANASASASDMDYNSTMVCCENEVRDAFPVSDDDPDFDAGCVDPTTKDAIADLEEQHFTAADPSSTTAGRAQPPAGYTTGTSFSPSAAVSANYTSLSAAASAAFSSAASLSAFAASFTVVSAAFAFLAAHADTAISFAAF
ncbi:hypothetical protein CYMTET_35664 [Cymbomonas tetramitiformis]|uniref:Uncharacterized protein n=1 Tax=Cymbomonas tetramitiformis TaxID=36881 RepID=A0AAE0F8V6_9CHLO|nr:hypothetical protein CYMTET_35664 [Cymbomonas tetramitiformis]